MLAYGWANTVSPRRAGVDEARLASATADAAGGQLVTLPTNPGRRHRPLSKEAGFGAAVADAEPL